MKRIFIGSSSEALGEAKQIFSILLDDDVKPVIWNDIFPPSILTFQAIEKESREVSGAIIVATPDDRSIIRRRKYWVPRTNVMIEYGYFSAILGRERIALCKYEDVTLTTDLMGLTYIDMGKFPEPGDTRILTTDVSDKIRKWAKSLPDVFNGIPNSDVLHGYSGTWEIMMSFEKWRGHIIREPDYAMVTGKMILHIPMPSFGESVQGSGSALAQLSASVNGLSADFLVSDEISYVQVEKDGTLKFKSSTHNRQRVRPHDSPGNIEGFQHEISGPDLFQWALKPVLRQPRRLEGTYEAWAGDSLRSCSKRVIADKVGSW
jgi:hypothetical protein